MLIPFVDEWDGLANLPNRATPLDCTSLLEASILGHVPVTACFGSDISGGILE
jgi:hypothetical protein